MGTTVEKLNKLKTTKEAIRTAINNKGGTLTESDKFSDYATAIDNIQSGGGEENPLQYVIDNNGGDGIPSCNYLFYNYKGSSLDNVINKLDTSKVTDMSYMFNKCEKLTIISQLDTSSCTYTASMFDNCLSLTSIPQLDTSKVTNMISMFKKCEKLTTIPQLDTSKVVRMDHMFTDCLHLTTIPLLDTSSCTDMSYMFENCHRLTKIDITHMNITASYKLTSFASYNCSLTKLIIRNMDTIPTLSSDAFSNCYHFTGTVNATYNPEGLKDGRIYVPDDKVEELKTATNWSVFADIIVPLSTLVEE